MITMISIELQVKSLKKAIEKNSGRMPEEWKPLINFIEFSLEFMKLFTNEKIDPLIDEVLKSIEKAERK